MNDEHTERKYITFFLLGWGECCIICELLRFCHGVSLERDHLDNDRYFPWSDKVEGWEGGIQKGAYIIRSG